MYSGRLGNGIPKPPGAYATDIEPWNVGYTQKQLSALFYGGNVARDVSWFVALDGEEFIPVPGTARERYKPGPSIGVNVVTHGPNIMLP